MTVAIPRYVTGYALRIAPAVAEQESPVSSALGIWLLLALVAPAAAGDDRDELEAALGCPADEAAKLAGDLLADPPPALSAATALWSRPERRRPAFERWTAGLPAELDQGPVPSQEQADRWVDEHTLGLIRSMPVDMARVVVVLVSALATRVSWVQPFDLAPSERFGPASPWRGRIDNVLADPGEQGNRMAIVDTGAAGLVGVHAARSREGLELVSVIAEGQVNRSRVSVAAHQAVGALVGETTDARVVPPAELPLGDGPVWTVNEVDGEDQYSAVLPAWHVDGELDLLADPAFAASPAVWAIPGIADFGDKPRGVQVATATYDREGFEAAAVTVIGRVTARRPLGRTGRHVHLRFERPFVALAIAGSGSRHAGLPLFEAWVSEPLDATERRRSSRPPE